MGRITEKDLQNVSLENNLCDNQLVKRFNNGDEEALNYLIRKYKGIAYLYIDRYCTLFPKLLERKELYQMSLISLYRSVIGYDETKNSSFSNFFSIIFERDILMLLRHLKTNVVKANYQSVSLDMRLAETKGIYLSEVIEDRHEYFNPERRAIDGCIYDEIEEELKKHTDKDALAFRMWMFGYSYREICEMCEMSEKQVEYILRKIRSNLKVCLANWR